MMGVLLSHHLMNRWFRRRPAPLRRAELDVVFRLPDQTRIYAIGDVHGRYDLLRERLAAIDRHRSTYPIARAVEVYLGDYIDRGQDSRAVIELLLERRGRVEAYPLAGNHEMMMLRAFEEESQAAADDWIRVGGLATLTSYGIAASQLSDPARIAEAVEQWRLAMPSSHLDFLKRLDLSFVCGDYIFVHAGLRPGIPLEAQSAQDLLWIRDEFLNYGDLFEKRVVHGHSPVAAPDFRPNRINLDTAAFASGRLTCLVLEADRAEILA